MFPANSARRMKLNLSLHQTQNLVSNETDVNMRGKFLGKKIIRRLRQAGQ